jgi:TRAP-type mannitol/chloroaromatic compound transport system permease large subunit
VCYPANVFSDPTLGLCYLMGVAPAGHTMGNRYNGIIFLVFLQVLELAILRVFPSLVRWPSALFFGSNE